MLATSNDLELKAHPSPVSVRSETAPQGIAPERLHPSIWLAHQLGRQGGSTVPSGFAALDAELPGGGWPRRCLSELLMRHPGIGEIRLLAPALAEAQKKGVIMLFDPPLQLSAAALAGFGLDLEMLLVVSTRARVIPGSDSLWALEQALKSGHVGAVLAWLPMRLRAERLRRLQLAAHNHDGVAFVVREAAVADRPSASPLRLALRPGGADSIQIHVVKRRGPPLLAPLTLELPPVLSSAAKRRSRSAASGLALHTLNHERAVDNASLPSMRMHSPTTGCRSRPAAV